VASSSTVTATTGATGHGASHASVAGSGGAGGGGLGPPYPVVLAHGFFGFEAFAGAEFATYFYEVKEHLAASGEIVHTPAVDPFNDSDDRGAQLLAHVEAILAETGHAKVNLIGHSQGGLDARVVASLRPDLVASVITVATPHHGTPIADLALGATGPVSKDVVDWIVKVVGAPLYDAIGRETSLAEALYLFSKDGIAAFNDHHPNRPGVLYASITGRTDESYGGDDCIPDVDLPFVSQWASTKDPTDPAFALAEAILDGDLAGTIPNDGLVRVADARWGEFWGCIPADHLDEVGQLFGDGPGQGNAWNHLAFYEALIATLRQRGL
jgi:triacylglycerol lipase